MRCLYKHGCARHGVVSGMCAFHWDLLADKREADRKTRLNGVFPRVKGGA